MRSRITSAALAAATLTAGLVLAAPPAAAAGRALSWDFNGDGYRDLAVGVPIGEASGSRDAGYVAIVPGSARGPVTSGQDNISQNDPGVPGGSEGGDMFGSQLASADLNSDGYAELVVSAPGEDAGRGRITILWSGKSGFTRGTTVTGPTRFDYLGRDGLLIADVTGDRRADIVTVSSDGDKPGVYVLNGPFSPTVNPAATRVASLPPFSGADAIAVGDFDGDGRNDLAITGYLTKFLRGTADGLAEPTGWYTETVGHDLVVADFDRDGFTDLAFGDARIDRNVQDPQYPVRRDIGGVVRIVYGSQLGPGVTRGPADISQESPGVPGTGIGDSEQADYFGTALTVADINRDGNPDLGIGSPGESLGSAEFTGAATVLYGSAAGLTGEGAQFFSQNTSGVPGDNEDEDFFGLELRLRDVTGDVRPELLVGAPGEDLRRGRVVMLPGTASAITGAGAKSYSRGNLTLPGSAVRFGQVIG